MKNYKINVNATKYIKDFYQDLKPYILNDDNIAVFDNKSEYLWWIELEKAFDYLKNHKDIVADLELKNCITELNDYITLYKQLKGSN